MRSTTNELSVRGLILPAIGDFRRYGRSLIFFGILFGVVNSLVLAPAFALVFTFVVRWSGGHVVTNEEILGAFLSRSGVLGTLVLVAAVMTTTMTHLAGLMMVYANLRMRRSVEWVRALLAMVTKLPGILLINIVRAVVLLLVMLPFLAIGASFYYRFLADYDLNYLVQVRPAAFWWGAVAAALLIAIAGFCVLVAHTRVMFAFPAYFFGRLSAMAALRQGCSLARGHTLRLVWIIAVWLVMAWTLNFALGTLFDRLAPTIVPMAGRRLGTLVVVIGLVLAFEALAHAALNVVTLVIKAIVVTRAYMLVNADDELSVPAETASGTVHQRQTRLAVGLVGVAYLVGAYVTAAGLLENLDLADEVAIVAHRGDSRNAPENTLAAIERAIEEGANFVEIDVQQTADGVVVVFHDTDFRRVTGLEQNIWDLTYDQIRELDAGSWHSSEYAGERIPTLADAIKLAKRRVPLVIEIKRTEHDQRLVESVVRTIDEKKFGSQCIVASLSRGVLNEVAGLAPHLDRGYLVYQTLGDVRQIEADYLMVEAAQATPLAILSAHDAGKQIFAWTVNDARRMSVMIDRGVDGIMTDDPGLLAAVLEQRAGLTDLERIVLRFTEFVSR
jgi:glycerophosphoryl diester phosphodiesterase